MVVGVKVALEGHTRESWGDKIGELWEHRKPVLHTPSLELLLSHSMGRGSPGVGFGSRAGGDLGEVLERSWEQLSAYLGFSGTILILKPGFLLTGHRQNIDLDTCFSKQGHQ